MAKRKKKRGRPPVKDPLIQIGVRLRPATIDDLNKIACEQDWNYGLSNIIRIACLEFIQKHQKK